MTDRHIETRLAAERVRVTVTLAERGIVTPDLTGRWVRELEQLGVPHTVAVDLVAQGKRAGSEAAAAVARIAADLDARGVA